LRRATESGKNECTFSGYGEVGKCHFPIISEQVLSDAVNAAFSLARHLGEETVQVL